MFQQQSSDYLRNDYLRKIQIVVAQLTLDQIWWRPNDASNSIGNLVLHLAGNVRQWIVGGVGRQPVARNRDLEFSSRDQISADQLVARLATAVEDACGVIERVTDDQLAEPRQIQRFDTTVLGAIYHVVEHFAMHTGQIILLAKMQTDKDAGLYKLRPDGTPEPTFTSRRAFAKE